MARPKLSSMLDVATATTKDPEPASTPEPAAAAPSLETVVPVSVDETPSSPAPAPARQPRSKTAGRQKKPASSHVRYDEYERVEARLDVDQVVDLDRLARVLNKRSAPGSARITKNTLIRVAVNVLLDQAGQLNGSDEAELRNSLTT